MLSGDLTLLSTLFFRYLFSLPILGLVAWRARGRDMLHITQRRIMVIRVMFGLAGITFWFLSVRNIPQVRRQHFFNPLFCLSP